MPKRFAAKIARPQRARHPRIPLLARHHEVCRRLDDQDTINHGVVGVIKCEIGAREFNRSQRVEVLCIITVEKARPLQDYRSKEFGDLWLVGLSDPGEPEHTGVHRIAQHGMRNLSNTDDPLLQALDDRHGRDHGAVTDHEIDLVAIGVIADPAVIS